MSLRSQIATQPLQRAAEAGFIELPPMSRVVEIVPGSIDDVAGTVDVVASAGTTVRRYGWLEEFDERLNISDETVDLRRLNSGAPVLDTHSWYGGTNAIRGITVPGSARIVDGKVVERLKVDRDLVIDGEAVGAELWRKIRAGFVRFLSIGYDARYKRVRAKDRTDGVNDVDLIESEYLNIYETSFVPAGADPEAAVRSAPHGATRRYALRSTEESPMPETQTPAPVTTPVLDEQAIAKRTIERVAMFEAHARSLNVDPEKARKLVAEFPDDGKVGLELIKLAAERQKADTIVGGQPPMLSVGREVGEKQADAIVNGLAARMFPAKYGGAKLKDEHEKRASRMTLLELAKQSLEAAGIRGVANMSKSEIAGLALSSYARAGGLSSTSDYPYLLATTQNKILLDLYVERPAPWRSFCRRMDRPDFKQFTMPQRSAAPSLQVVEEGGQIQRGAYSERTPETGRLKTAAITVAHTRQMIVNDDLAAFNDQTLGLAAAAGRYEDDTVMALITGNPTMADSETLFSSAHGNISGDTGTPDIDAIHAAMLKMAAQTGLKSEKLNLRPKYILASFKEYLAAQQTLALPPRMVPITGATTASVEAQGLELLWDERLNDGSGISDWYLIADPAQIAGIYYGGLEGDPSPRLSLDVEFSTDGVLRKLVHDFYGALADYRWIVQTTD